VRCPVCEWEAEDQAVDCEQCGRVLRSAASAVRFAPPVDGLEATLHPRIDVPVETIAGLEPTALDEGGIPLPDDHIEVEPTQLDTPAYRSSSRTGKVELEPGREEDLPPRSRQLCPACFGRVLPYFDAVRGVLRCSECGVPLPLV
jgi:hypothetical protein